MEKKEKKKENVETFPNNLFSSYCIDAPADVVKERMHEQGYVQLWESMHQYVSNSWFRADWYSLYLKSYVEERYLFRDRLKLSNNA